MAIHRKLVVLVVCAVLWTAPCSAESKKDAEAIKAELLTASPSTPPRVIKQINKVNEDNSYTVGYESEDGSFKIESRDSEGHIKGMFAYLDSSGQLKRFAYSTRPEDAFANLDTNKLLPVTERSSPAGSSTKKPPTVRRQLRYRRPQETESPEDPSPVLSMLLRRSRQNVPQRSDADELLRIQQQQHQLHHLADAGDIYGSGYQDAGQLRQQLMRGRVQNAVLRHLSPGQLQELQQYVTPEARRALNPALRALMSPVFDYLSSREQAEYGATPYDPYFPFYQQQQPQVQNYPQSLFYRSNPFYQQQQSQGVYDDLRHALIQRMLLAARLLGVEGMLQPQRYALDADQYGDRLLGQRFYTQPDTRLSYNNLRSLPYQSTLQLARETHERQLAAYQASIAAQGGAVGRAYPRGDDQQQSFTVAYSPDSEYEYSTVTPATLVRSTTGRSSNIQRVRNVQVITAATASPSTATTASSPTTPRRY